MLDKNLWREARQAWGSLLLTVGFGFAGAVAIVVQAWLLSGVIRRVFLDGQGLQDVAPDLLGLLAVILLRAALTMGREVSAGYAAIGIKTGLRERLFTHVMALGPAYARGERTGELANTMVEGVEEFEAYFSQYLPQVALAALIPLTILFSVLPLDLLSGIVLLVTAPLIPLFMVLIGKAAESLRDRQWRLLSRLSAHFLDILQGLTTLKTLGRSRGQAENIRAVSDQYANVTMKVLRVAFLSALALEMLATISTAVVAVEIGLRLLYGRLAFQEALFILVLAPEFYQPLRELGARFHAGMQGIAAAERNYAILSIPVSVSQTARRGTAPPFGKQITFENVHFAYPGGRQAALDGVSFTINARQKVALVGPSGAGKSTLAHLLLGFMQPQRGEIRVDGRPLNDVSPATWREQVAWVPQMPYLFHDTVAANLRLANPSASESDLMRAAEMAHVHADILALTEGYDTVIGERGTRLSGGQAQRLALARAFLKDAPLLILDEPTSNLDPQNEALLNEAITRLLHDRTALIIAHRLNTAQAADEVVVLEEGRVIQQGDPRALAGQPGLFGRLVRAGTGE